MTEEEKRLKRCCVFGTNRNVNPTSTILQDLERSLVAAYNSGYRSFLIDYEDTLGTDSVGMLNQMRDMDPDINIVIATTTPIENFQAQWFRTFGTRKDMLDWLFVASTRGIVNAVPDDTELLETCRRCFTWGKPLVLLS